MPAWSSSQCPSTHCDQTELAVSELLTSLIVLNDMENSDNAVLRLRWFHQKIELSNEVMDLEADCDVNNMDDDSCRIEKRKLKAALRNQLLTTATKQAFAGF